MRILSTFAIAASSVALSGASYIFSSSSSSSSSDSLNHLQQQQHHEQSTTDDKLDFSRIHEVRSWIKDQIQNKSQVFVKEVDTFHSPPNVSVPSSSSSSLPPTQLQVWRLGKDPSTDFPPTSKQEQLEEKNFPLYFPSEEEDAKQHSKISQAPVLRLVVYLPKATTARAMSESTDPSRRGKWDSQYDEFWILQEFQNKKKNNNKNSTSSNPTNDNELSKSWSGFSQTEFNSPNCVFKFDELKSNPLRKEAQELLASPSYHNDLLAKRLRMEDGFEIDYVRWTFHRIYSKMTATFGVKPRLSFMERIYASKRVEGGFVIRTDVDCSLPFKPRTENPMKNENENNKEEKNKKSTTLSKLSLKALDLAQNITHDCCQLPRKDDIPVHSHFQEMLMFPVPKGTTADKVGELAEALGKDELSGLVSWYENDWLKKVLSSEPFQEQQQEKKESISQQEGTMFSFTTVNSTGLVGNPRWFERYVQKVFSSHAMGNLLTSIHSIDEPPKEHCGRRK